MIKLFRVDSGTQQVFPLFKKYILLKESGCPCREMERELDKVNLTEVGYCDQSSTRNPETCLLSMDTQLAVWLFTWLMEMWT